MEADAGADAPQINVRPHTGPPPASPAASAVTDAPNGSRSAPRPTVTVVVCAYTPARLEVLRAAVAAAVRQLGEEDELVVVIDHSDALLAAAREALDRELTRVRVITNMNARGLSGARNAGVEAAQGELIVFLDDDAVPQPDWLAELTEPFGDEGVIGTGGTASPAWDGEQPGWMPDEFLWVVGCSYRGLPGLPTPIRNPIGANMAFRRSALRQAGGFTDGIGRVGRVPLGCEETEFSIRATRATGGRIVQQPSARVEHLVPADRASVRYFLRRCWAEGISKAYVAKLTGGEAALSSERRYATRTLPAGVVAGIRDGFAGRPGGFRRAAAIVGGLAVTVAGYLRGSVRPLPRRLRRRAG